MGYGDLWGSESTVLIFYKSITGIYGDLWVDRGGFMGIYRKFSGDINPINPSPEFIKKSILLIMIPINPHNP